MSAGLHSPTVYAEEEGVQTPEVSVLPKITIHRQQVLEGLRNFFCKDGVSEIRKKGRYALSCLLAANNEALKKTRINRHHIGHLLTDGAWTLQLFEEFRTENDEELTPEMAEAATLGALIHDIEYRPELTEEVMDRSQKPEVIAKKLLDFHPARSARRVAQLLCDDRFTIELEGIERMHMIDFFGRNELTMLEEWDPAFVAAIREHTKDWTPEQKETAIRSVLYHSNGSEGYDSSVPLTWKVLRLVDKLEMHRRVFPSHLPPNLRDIDPLPEHRIFPASVNWRDPRGGMWMDCDLEAETFTVNYAVSPDTPGPGGVALSAHLAEGLTDDDIEQAFDDAYGGKAMKIAAEVACSLLEHKKGSSLQNAEPFVVRLHFRERVVERFYSHPGRASSSRAHPPGDTANLSQSL